MRTFSVQQATLLGLITASLVLLPKLQLLSGHIEEKSLAIYWDLALTDVWRSTKRRCGYSRSAEMESYCAPSQLPFCYPEIEATDWGQAQRLNSPITIEGTPMRWESPARKLGSSEARWR